MSVDKFGRSSERNVHGKAGPPGIGFLLTLDGAYDLSEKRIKNLNHPVDKNDAVNKIYFDNKFNYIDKQIKSIADELKNKTDIVNQLLNQMLTFKVEVGILSNSNKQLSKQVNDMGTFVNNAISDEMKKIKTEFDMTLKGLEKFFEIKDDDTIKRLVVLENSIEKLHKVLDF